MADEVPLSFEGEPYVWDNGQDHLPESVVTLWTEVANGLEKSQTGKLSFGHRRGICLGFRGRNVRSSGYIVFVVH
jgi:hypothetical protein